MSNIIYSLSVNKMFDTNLRRAAKKFGCTYSRSKTSGVSLVIPSEALDKYRATARSEK